MSTYCHIIDRQAFQYQVARVAKEMKFRIGELIDASSSEIRKFHVAISSGQPLDESAQDVVQYRFTAVLAMLQTFRDALIGAGVISQGSPDIETDVVHADTFRKLRNAVVHDGYQPVGAWADGRYYLPVNIKRMAMVRGKQVEILIDAPEEDVETLCLQFASQYCEKLAIQLDGLDQDQKLNGPEFSRDWFIAASSHPCAKQRIKIEDLPSKENWPLPPPGTLAPLDKAANTLREIVSACQTRLTQLKTLPVIPFS